MILKILEFFGIIILVSLGGYILITLIIAMVKSIIKQVRKWGVDSEILCDYNTKK